MFSSSVPATHDRFYDRDLELGRLEQMVSRLARGVPQWLCLVGPRKVAVLPSAATRPSVVVETSNQAFRRRGRSSRSTKLGK